MLLMWRLLLTVTHSLAHSPAGGWGRRFTCTSMHEGLFWLEWAGNQQTRVCDVALDPPPPDQIAPLELQMPFS